jgi:hypothetical protein
LFTASFSWEICALDVPELPVEPDEGVVLELLDEHAASSIAAPAATAP